MRLSLLRRSTATLSFYALLFHLPDISTVDL